MKLEELNKIYDKLQLKYGDKELDSIYNGGCVENPDICFVFMNPTKRNIASLKSWEGPKSPWIGTKNIWSLFYLILLTSLKSPNISLIKLLYQILTLIFYNIYINLVQTMNR